MREFKFSQARAGAAITVRVIPRAKKNELAGLMADGTVQVRVTAPPVDGEANAAVIALLAEVLGLKANQFEIVAGMRSQKKLISILGLDARAVDAKIQAAITASKGKKRE